MLRPSPNHRTQRLPNDDDDDDDDMYSQTTETNTRAFGPLTTFESAVTVDTVWLYSRVCIAL